MRMLLAATIALFATHAHATVLCAKPKHDGSFSTSVRIRETCRVSEVQLAPDMVGFCCTTTTTTSTSTTGTAATTSTSSATSTTTTTMPPSGCFTDLGETILDACTGLQWEKKTTAVGSGVNGADLHDVDNIYPWAGTCSVNTSKRCQPTAAAETLCQAQTPAAYWANGCQRCTGGDGTCTVASGITTVWDWLDGVQTANFAGHNDWRLPSEDGCNSCWTGSPTFKCPCAGAELESILLASYPCGMSPCIASIFGPTASSYYWSASAGPPIPDGAWTVLFANGYVNSGNKFNGVDYVRAVR